jgi:chromosome partitioning protein
MNIAAHVDEIGFADTILDQGSEISRKLDMLRTEKFPPNAQKTLRQFSLAEVAEYIGVSQSYLKKLHLEGKGVLAVVNFKGGSGKTTTAAHLAQHLALTGHRVLAIDLDPQASLTALHGIQPELDQNPSLYESLRYDDEKKSIVEVIRTTNFPNLDIVPANLELQEYEYDTPLAMQVKGSNAGKMFYTRIGDALAEVDDRYDVVVIDCPPQLGYLTLTALTTATSVLITVHPQMLDIMSMSQFLLMLGEILKSIEGAGVKVSLNWFRYLVTRFEPTDIPQTQMVGFMQSMFAKQMLKNHMLKSTAISDAGLTKQTLYEVERSQFIRSTYDRAMESLNAVNGEIAALVHQAWGRKQ